MSNCSIPQLDTNDLKPNINFRLSIDIKDTL